MPPNDPEKLNRIERLKSKLFSKDFETRMEHRDDLTHLDMRRVPDAWEDEHEAGNVFSEKFFMKTSLFKKFFLFSVCFFALALVYASYTFFFGGNTVSNDNIEIAILGNTFTAGGEELPLQIEITNKNNSPLELVDLVVEYPKGSSGDLSKDTERIRESLGTIPAGAVRTENMKVVLFGEQGSIKQMRIAIEYRVEGSNAIFLKERLYDVSINSTPVNLSVDAPSEISPNQDITLNIKTSLNATRVASNMLLRIDYPLGFQFISGKPAPAYGNNVWNLGDLAPGAELEVSVTGKMFDVFDGEEKNFRIWTGSQSATEKSVIEVVFNSLAHSVLVKKPFIEAQLFINGVYQREYAIDTKTQVQGEIRYTNSLDTKINDLEIKAKLSGNVFTGKSVNVTQGRYDSLNSTIVWDRNSISRFREVDSMETEFVTFTLPPLSTFSASGEMLIDPSLRIEVSISGRQPLEGNAVKNLTNSESKTIKVLSEVGLAAKALYYYGPFKNTGPIPPRAEEETTYTIVWTLSNTANNISRAKVSATLPPWVRFVGAFSPQTEDLSFNSSTKEIIWNVGNIPRGTGISTSGREVSFQVALLPSLSQVGEMLTLINDSTLTGIDDFANLSIRVNKASLNTRLVNDSSFPANGDRVVD